MTTLNPELIKAILSMDAYNRGYDQSIELDGYAVGTAEIRMTLNDLGESAPLDSGILDDDDAAIGFYALAYDVDLDGDGTVDETVISYRGTDDFDGVTVAEYGGLS